MVSKELSSKERGEWQGGGMGGWCVHLKQWQHRLGTALFVAHRVILTPLTLAL